MGTGPITAKTITLTELAKAASMKTTELKKAVAGSEALKIDINGSNSYYKVNRTKAGITFSRIEATQYNAAALTRNAEKGRKESATATGGTTIGQHKAMAEARRSSSGLPTKNTSPVSIDSLLRGDTLGPEARRALKETKADGLPSDSATLVQPKRFRASDQSTIRLQRLSPKMVAARRKAHGKEIIQSSRDAEERGFAKLGHRRGPGSSSPTEIAAKPQKMDKKTSAPGRAEPAKINPMKTGNVNAPGAVFDYMTTALLAGGKKRMDV